MKKINEIARLIYNFIFKTRRRKLTVKTLFLVAIARFRIYFYHGSKIHKYLGTPGETPYEDLTRREDINNMLFVAEKVARVARRVPWQSKCLVQAMVAQRLLKSYKLQSTLYLGVGRDKEQNNKMVAHAWVRCGKVYVCGGKGEDYATVAKFVM